MAFVVVKLFLIITIQKVNNAQRFLEKGEEMLRIHVRHLFSTRHVMYKTFTSSNRVSIGDHVVEEGVVDLLEGVVFLSSLVGKSEVLTSKNSMTSTLTLDILRHIGIKV